VIPVGSRLDELDLAQQVVLAVVDLSRMRIAIAGRPALQHVHHEDVRAGHPDVGQQAIQELARLADERDPLLVLVAARGLADEHEVGVGIARAEYDGRAGGRELWAAGASAGLLEDGLQLLAAGFARGRRHRSILDAGPAAVTGGRRPL
jgi:hypothetical protein